MKKRGMLQQQVFYYILGAVMISLILFFGYQQIVKLTGFNEQANFVKFKTDFQDALNDIYYKNPGSTAIYSLTSTNKPLLLPRDVKEVCFEKENNNIRVKADSEYFTSFIVENLITKDIQAKYCIKTVNSRLSFTLENKIVNGKTIIEIR